MQQVFVDERIVTQHATVSLTSAMKFRTMLFSNPIHDKLSVAICCPLALFLWGSKLLEVVRISVLMAKAREDDP